MTGERLSPRIRLVVVARMKEKKLDIEAINDSHARRIDKWYRMCAGTSSTLVSYESEVIELEVRQSSRWPKSPPVTARQFAENWKQSNRELSDAVAFLVHIYESRIPDGFITPTKPIETENGRKKLVEALAMKIHQCMTAPREDILIATIRGRFDHPLPPELR